MTEAYEVMRKALMRIEQQDPWHPAPGYDWWLHWRSIASEALAKVVEIETRPGRSKPEGNTCAARDGERCIYQTRGNCAFCGESE